jgi:pimeloyl-ACP methyl ester carboxylesterase
MSVLASWRRAVSGWTWRRWLAIYLLLLALSNAVQLCIPQEWYRLPGPAYQHRDVDADGTHATIGFIEWTPEGGAPAERPAVVLLHGCPGQATDFVRLGPVLRDAGYRVLAVDQLGFGESSHWVRDYSIAANGRVLTRFLADLGIARAHVVGWSNGGGTALHMAELAPERVASLTLMASIGVQEDEGSGSYFFEHVKYFVGLGGGGAAAELIPHFGLLGPAWLRNASMRFFWDSDQRPLRAVMERLRTPTLVLHGRNDFLVPARAAERSHGLIGPSRLVMLPASHFLPFMQAPQSGEHLVRFFARHDSAGVAALRQTADLAPEGAHLFGAFGARGETVLQRLPWWLLVLAVAIGVSWRQRGAAVIAALCVSFGVLDLGVALAGILAALAFTCIRAWVRGRGLSEAPVIGQGIHARSRRLWRSELGERPIRIGLGSRFVPGGQEAAFAAAGVLGRARALLWLSAAVSWLLWGLLYTVPILISAMFVPPPLAEKLGVPGLIAGAMVAWVFVRALELCFTRTGRRLLRTKWGRAARREYWPTALLYAPLAPLIAHLAFRHGLTTFTCCNPGIDGGGGMIGESKKRILEHLGDCPSTLPAEYIPAGTDPADRALRTIAALSARPELGGFPVILKPDAGQRGFAVRVARSADDIGAYFRAVTTPVLVQRFHPGPEECGVLWIREPGRDAGAVQADHRLGRVYSVTRKEFPVLTGDGRHSLEELIWRHPRFHRQAGVFLERFADQRDRVPALGERIRLSQSGNHCQGTLFRDGADLITPELEGRIDAIARAFRGGLDIGRFDLRYESDDALRRGAGFAIVELNGTAGESTNIYDPGRSIRWCYRVLGGQMKRVYALGSERRAQGFRPMPAWQLLAAARAHYRHRSGPELAD